MNFINASAVVTIVFCAITGFNKVRPKQENAFVQQDTTLNITLPPEGKLNNGKPVGKKWVSLLRSADDWNLDNTYWKLENGELHCDYMGGELHNYGWAKKSYKDFELNVLFKLTGEHPNSGVCIRIHPTSADDAPGYQVDMGEGYWGSLWEERRGNMIQKFPAPLAHKIVNENDWNHYYIKAQGHHIEAWLNGVKTIDKIHMEGFEDGNIGFQLVHGKPHTILDVKACYIREIK